MATILDETPRPLILPHAGTRTVRSPADGFDYRIYCALPTQPPPDAGYPAIFLLDANATFLTTVEAMRMRAARQASTGVSPAVVVGIGYDTDGPYDQNRRIYDFSLPHTTDRPRAGGMPRPTGGALALAQFIIGTVRPLIAREIPLDAERQALFGHSLGAYFVLSRLLLAPHDFQTYVAISPSVWWDEDWLHAGTHGLDARIGAAISPRRLLIAVGEYEQCLAPWQQTLPERDRVITLRRERAMVDRSRHIARRIAERGRERIAVRFEEMPGEDHSSAALTGISRGLRLALWQDAAVLRNL
ncbi:alpha/beta hydrolase [Pseudochelatococcus sp.]|uniref:alpha/beta hydrolase n=1 Tax=Pseudochelatococcus sp. TaxID=2020869 RepID=UPI003D8C6BA5